MPEIKIVVFVPKSLKIDEHTYTYKAVHPTKNMLSIAFSFVRA